MDELVEVVIKIPKKCKEFLDNGGKVDWLDAIPIIDAVANGTIRSKGHWIQQSRYEGDEQPDLVCPICGEKIGWWDLGNFCAGCGTELEGGAG